MIKIDKFIDNYCKASRISSEVYNKLFVTLKCKCGAENCKGLAAISNNSISIEMHMELHYPKETE